MCIRDRVSCLSGVPVRGDVAMTGEITLHGNVLPIGGLREKSIDVYKRQDNTLLNFDAAENKALTETLVNFGIEPDAETVQTYRTINEELWRCLLYTSRCV